MSIRMLPIGNKYNRLTILSISDKITKSRNRYYECMCDCGNKALVSSGNLKSGGVKSCGCQKIESARIICTTHDKSNYPEYKVWCHFKDRCYNINNKSYKNYGGRGIKICDRWLKSFDNFISDMGRKPSGKHTLDRFPDVNGDYEPNNCRWATMKQQNSNRRNNVWYEYNSLKMIQEDWGIYLGTTGNNLSKYLKNRTFEQAYLFYRGKQEINN